MTYFLIQANALVLAAHADTKQFSVALAHLNHTDISAFVTAATVLDHTLLFAEFKGRLITMPALKIMSF